MLSVEEKLETLRDAVRGLRSRVARLEQQAGNGTRQRGAGNGPKRGRANGPPGGKQERILPGAFR